VPLGDGPRDHPLLKDLNLGPLGGSTRASPLVTATLLFVSQMAGGLGGAQNLPVGGRPLSKLAPEEAKFRAFDKATGQLVWEMALPRSPAASPMTYLHAGRQFLVVAVGGATEAELVALSLP
jgi:quinoprotein glucose dehydrogenase